MNAATGSVAILAVVAHAEVEEHALVDVVDADVAEGHVAHGDVVAVVDGDAPLVINLLLALLKDVDVVVHHLLDDLIPLNVAMQANHDGMGHVGPIHGVCHADVVASAVVVLAGAIDGGAIVACATKHVVVAHVVAGKDIHAIAPPIPTDDLGVAHADTLASAHRNLRGDGTVDHHVGRIPDHDALMLALGIDNAVTDDLGVECLPYRGEALDVSAAGYIEHLAAAHTNGIVAQVVIAGTIKQHVFFLHPQGLGHLPGVLVDGGGGVGEELQVMVGVAVDLHREVERTVEREAKRCCRGGP